MNAYNIKDYHNYKINYKKLKILNIKMLNLII